jgi:hypothetical protein
MLVSQGIWITGAGENRKRHARSVLLMPEAMSVFILELRTQRTAIMLAGNHYGAA